MPNVSGVDVRRARAFLQARNVTSRAVSPRRFAVAAAELGKSFTELLRLIRRLSMAGQGIGQAPIAEELARKEAA